MVQTAIIDAMNRRNFRLANNVKMRIAVNFQKCIIENRKCLLPFVLKRRCFPFGFQKVCEENINSFIYPPPGPPTMPTPKSVPPEPKSWLRSCFTIVFLRYSL